MGLSLNNIYQRPFVNSDSRSRVKKREEEEKSAAANTQREENSNQNSKSKGLQYVEQKNPTYTPAYEQKFSMAAANAYANATTTSANFQNKQQTNIGTNQTQAVNTKAQNKIDSQINIAQILKDLKNTALAIGTPSDLAQEVDEYIDLIEKQSKKDVPNTKLVKSNLKNAASLLDGYISETLQKESQVV